MPSESMSVTRALAELKMLDKRIAKAISNLHPVTAVAGDRAPQGFASKDAFDEKAQADFRSVTDLIARRAALKSAVVASNAVTKVVIGETAMSVAEAIERKTSIANEQSLLAQLKQQFVAHVQFVENENGKVKLRLDQMVLQNLGKDAKVKDEEYEAIAGPFLKRNEVRLIDPLGVAARIEALEKGIDDFLLNVDFALSEANAKTEIAFSYGG